MLYFVGGITTTYGAADRHCTPGEQGKGNQWGCRAPLYFVVAGIYIYIYIPIYIHIHNIYTCIYICIYIRSIQRFDCDFPVARRSTDNCRSFSPSISIYTCTAVYIYIYVLCTCMYTRTKLYLYIYIYTYICIHT